MLNFISNPRHTLHSPERTFIMKLLLAALALFLLSDPASAQSGWRYIGPEEREIVSMSLLGDLIFASVRVPGSGRLYRSLDAGENWERVDTTTLPVGAATWILPGNPIKVLAAYYTYDPSRTRHFYISADSGRTWENHEMGQLPGDISRFYFRNGNDSGALFGVASIGRLDRLYRSTDYGRTWSWPYPFPQSSDGSKIAVGVSPTTPDVYVYVDTDIGGAYFFHSSDEGVTWEFVAESPVGMTSLLINPNLTDRIISFRGNEIIHSDDGGASWRSIHTRANLKRAFRSLIRSAEDANKLYLFVEPNIHLDLPGFISFSDSGGLTWADDSTSLTLPFKTVHNVFDPITWLQHDARRDRLYFQTEKGIYIRENLSTAISETVVQVSWGIQVHPQPASESLTVTTNFVNHASLTLRVFSTLGVLLREWHVAAPGSLQWDLRDRSNLEVPNGVYLLTAITGKDVVTRRIVIQR
jgi:photosystem II stability/assembly factor-like uncharacterized protein